MKQSWLLVALSCALPLHAMAQDAAPAPAPAAPPCRADTDATGRASAALPPRAATHPMPERGSVAPVNKHPSHVESASSRAMAAASARRQAQDAEKKSRAECEPASQQAEPVDGGRKA